MATRLTPTLELIHMAHLRPGVGIRSLVQMDLVVPSLVLQGQAALLQLQVTTATFATVVAAVMVVPQSQRECVHLRTITVPHMKLATFHMTDETGVTVSQMWIHITGLQLQHQCQDLEVVITHALVSLLLVGLL